MPLKKQEPISLKLDICGPNEEFFSLLKKGSLSELREVLNNYSNILNKIKKKGETALHVASKYGHIDIVKHLIENFNSVTNINIQDDVKKKTPLHIACENGHVQIVKYLLSKGVNIYILDSKGNTSLQCSVVSNQKDENKREEIVKCLIDEIILKRKKKKNGIISFSCYSNNYGYETLRNKKIARMLIENEIIDSDCKDKRGLTLLHDLCMDLDSKENLEFMKYLVEDNNVDINALDAMKNTALHSNLLHDENDSGETIKYLVDKGADLSIKNEDGNTVLFIAAYRQNINAVKYLLLKGANIEIKNFTVFHVAAEKVNLEMFKIFESYCCASDVVEISANTHHFESLIYHAIIGEYEDEDILGNDDFENRRMIMLEYLVEKYYKSTIDIKSGKVNPRTTLLIAAKKERLDAVKYLIEKGAKLENSPDILIEASKTGNLKMVKYLVEKGAEEITRGKGKGVKIDDKVGNEKTTALIASVNNINLINLELVKYLSTNSDINHREKTEEGFSALHHASIMGFSDIVEHLINSGADVNQLENEKESPLHLAVLNGNYETVKILIQNGAKTYIKNNEKKTPFDLANGDPQMINLMKRGERSPLPVGRINSSSLETISSLDLDYFSNNEEEGQEFYTERSNITDVPDRLPNDILSSINRMNDLNTGENEDDFFLDGQKQKKSMKRKSKQKKSIKKKLKQKKSMKKKLKQKKSIKKKSIKKYNISIK
jgi:ankyrin repeat protein